MGAFNKDLIEPFSYAIGQEGIMDVQVMNRSDILEVSFELLTYKLPSMVNFKACYTLGVMVGLGPSLILLIGLEGLEFCLQK